LAGAAGWATGALGAAATARVTVGAGVGRVTVGAGGGRVTVSAGGGRVTVTGGLTGELDIAGVTEAAGPEECPGG
jgi:hypothetical protein